MSPYDASTLYGPSRPSPQGDVYEVQKGLLIPASSLTRATVWHLGQRIEGPVVVASFVDLSLPDGGRIAEAAGPGFRALPDTLDGVRALVRQQKAGVFVLVGHSLDGFLIREALQDGVMVESGRLPLQELAHIVQASGSALLVLSCKAAQQAPAPGTMEDIWTPEAVSRIQAALQARTFGDFYAAFGSVANPVLLRDVGLFMSGSVMSFVARFAVGKDNQAIEASIRSRLGTGPPPVPQPIALNWLGDVLVLLGAGGVCCLCCAIIAHADDNTPDGGRAVPDAVLAAGNRAYPAGARPPVFPSGDDLPVPTDVRASLRAVWDTRTPATAYQRLVVLFAAYGSGLLGKGALAEQALAVAASLRQPSAGAVNNVPGVAQC